MKHCVLRFLAFAALGSVLIAGCATVKEHGVSGRYTALQAELHSSDSSGSARDNFPVLNDESTLDDYLAYAALNNPGLEAAFNRWKAALERVPQVRSLPDPKFTYTYFIREIETRTGPQRQRFGLAQMFPWFGTLELRGDVAIEAANAQQQRYEAAKLRLFYRVKDAYYEYYYLWRAVAVTEEIHQLLESLETVAETRYTAGLAPYAGLIKAQVELDRLDDRLRTLRELRGPIVARLNAALNRREDAPLPWPNAIPEEVVSFSSERLFEWLEENNPELKALDAAIAREDSAIDLAKKGYYPDFTLGLNYMETGSARMPNVSDSSEDPVAVMLSVNVPLWREKYAAAVSEAKARRDAAMNDRLNRENMLVADVEMALFRFRDAERKIALYRDSLVPKADRSLNATRQAFVAGKAGFFDVIEAEQTLLEFKLTYERAVADRAQRLAELEMLVGKGISGI